MFTLDSRKKHIESLFHSTSNEKNNKYHNNHYEQYNLYDNYNFAPVNELLGKFIDRVDSAYHGAGHSELITTGFIDLDKLIHGFKSGELVVIAGRPCMGAFELGVNIIAHVATKLKKGVAVFSLNRSADDIVQYLMALITEIDLSILDNGNLKEIDWPKLTEAVEELSDSRIYINENKYLDFASLDAKVKKICAQQNIDLIVIDNLQWIEQKSKNYRAGYSTLVKNIQILARTLSVPVILLSSVSKKVEKRPNKRLMLLDLNSYGHLDELADTVMFLYRDERYNYESTQKSIIEVNVEKQNFDRTGSIRLSYRYKSGRLGSIRDID